MSNFLNDGTWNIVSSWFCSSSTAVQGVEASSALGKSHLRATWNMQFKKPDPPPPLLVKRGAVLSPWLRTAAAFWYFLCKFVVVNEIRHNVVAIYYRCPGIISCCVCYLTVHEFQLAVCLLPHCTPDAAFCSDAVCLCCLTSDCCSVYLWIWG